LPLVSTALAVSVNCTTDWSHTRHRLARLRVGRGARAVFAATSRCKDQQREVVASGSCATLAPDHPSVLCAHHMWRSLVHLVSACTQQRRVAPVQLHPCNKADGACSWPLTYM